MQRKPQPFHWTPIISLDYSSWFRLAELSIEDAIAEMEKRRKAVKAAVGYTWDNSHFRFSDIYGREYAFHISANYKREGGSLSVWDYTGGKSVGNYTLPADMEGRKAAFRQALEDSERWSAGEFQCAGHRGWVQGPPAGTIYAGQYCAECVKTDNYKRNKADEGI